MSLHTEKRILAIDYGSRRIGLAISDPLGIIAGGVGTLANTPEMLEQLVALIHELGVTRIIIGLPLTLKAEHGDSAKMVDRFRLNLAGKVSIPIESVDERFTSTIAEQTIRAMGVGKKKRRNKGKIDEIAAIVLLQGFLDRRK